MPSREQPLLYYCHYCGAPTGMLRCYRSPIIAVCSRCQFTNMEYWRNHPW